MTTSEDVGSPSDGGPDHDDDDALSWGADQDATYVDAPANALRAPKAPRPRTGDEPLASGSLIGMGVLGGVYLLYTVAWLVSAGTLPVDTGSHTALVASEVLRVLAVMAPALWFGATLWLGQGRRTRTRVLWLVAGALVLFPWPFVLTRSIL